MLGRSGCLIPDGTGLTKRFKPIVLLMASLPVFTSNRIWLTGYSGNRRSVFCLDLETEFVLSERSLEAVRSERKTAPNDAASSTPVTDGSNVYALFSEIGLAIQRFAASHENTFPDNLDVLFNEGYLKPPLESKSMLTGKPYVYVGRGQNRPAKRSDLFDLVLR